VPYIRQAESVCKLTVVGQMNLKPLVNTFYFAMNPADFNETNAASVGVRFRTSWSANMLGNFSPDYTFQRIELFSLDPVTEFAFDLAPTGSVVGTGGAPTMPPQVSILGHKTPSDAPRGFRPGRVYLGPPSEAQCGNDGTLLAALVTSVNTNLNLQHLTLDAPAGTPASTHVVPSWVGLTSPPPPAITPILASRIVRVFTMICDPKVATQRRRLR